MRAGGQLRAAVTPLAVADEDSRARAQGFAGAGSVCLDIAGVGLQFNPVTGVRCESPGDPYAPFLWTGRTPRPAVLLEAEVTAANRALGPLPGQALFDADGAWRLWSDGATRRFAWHGRFDEPVWMAETDEDYRRYRVVVGPMLQRIATHHVVVERLISYPLDQLMFMHAAPGAGRLLVHAAGLQTRRGVVVFAGPSGAGKSTLADLIDPQPGRLRLSDDRMVLQVTPDAVEAFGTPWPGDANIAQNRGGALRALCFLRHAPRTRLEPLPPELALQRLLPVSSIAWYEPAVMHRALDLVERLLQRVPLFDLGFRPNHTEIARVIEGFEQG